MKTTTYWYTMVPLTLTWCYSTPTLAFEDIYEPDNSFEQATQIVANANVRQQHTLHTQQDEDWFKFYAVAHIPCGSGSYDIKIKPVGKDIDVALDLYGPDGSTLLTKVNKAFNGQPETLTWSAPADGFYYLRVRDTAKPLAEGKCRLETQYELQIFDGCAALPWKVKGVVKDTSGTPIEGATVSSSCNLQDYSNPQGEYLLNGCPFPSGTYAITASKPGYKTLTCHLPASFSPEIPKNFFLPKAGETPLLQAVNINAEDKLVPSQTVYQRGETLRVEFPLFRLSPDSCILYYLGLEYPDKKLMVIKDFNVLEALNPTSLSHWIGIGHTTEKQDAQIVIEMPVDENWPRGQYKLHLLRMPALVEDPVSNLGLGEWNVSNFEVK
jgi:hypothetical protein